MRKLSAILIMFSLLCSTAPVFGANEDRIAELRRQIEELERQAAQYQSSIASERAKAQSLKTEINALKAEISRLETQITLTVKKIDKTKVEIGTLEEQIYDTQVYIDRQRGTIGELLIFLSQRDNENLLGTLMKNENLSAFLSQAQQVENVNNKLLELIAELRTRKQELEKNKNSLEGKKEDLIALSEEQAAKRSSLLDATGQRNKLLTRTKGQEAEYQKMLDEVERKKNTFFLELQKLENAAITGGNFIIHVKASGIPPRGTKLFSWPEASYRITQGYGMTTYARRGAYGGAPHNGVDLAGGFGTPIHPIGDGIVVANGYNSGFGNWVAVKNAYDMVSVYAHLSSFHSNARVGTEVKRSDVIGYEGSTGNSTGSHLHLSLYKDFFTYGKSGQLYFNYFDGSINPQDYL